MRAKVLVAALSCLSVAPLVGAAVTSDTDSAVVPRIVVGPNILVSHDGDVGHAETGIAANPRDAQNLVGTAIVMDMPDGGPANKVYVSYDGGATWEGIVLPHERRAGGADPQVAFGINGTACFVGLSMADGMNVYRSEDGGSTWSEPVNLGRGHDHEMIVVDHTYGPYAGRIYIADEQSVPGSREIEDLIMRRRVVLFRSSDDGRSFVGPIEVARGDDHGLAARFPVVLSDGTLFLPMIEYANSATDKETSTRRYVFSRSTDGGVTFSPRKLIALVQAGRPADQRRIRSSGRVDQRSSLVAAADTFGERYRDRIYAAWSEYENDRFRLMVSHSGDRGETWSPPLPVDPDAPDYASQSQHQLAVTPDGVLGVFWYDTEGYPERDRFDVYFSASLDGGESFLPKKRLSSQTSIPFGDGNLRPGPMVRPDRGLLVASFLSTMSRWPNGGDYIGLTADRDGRFHPLWTDARSGTYQLYTAQILVAEAAPDATTDVETMETEITDRVTLVFDPIRYDTDRREAVLPVRIKNTSGESLFPPFRVEIKEFAHPYRVKAGFVGSLPTVLNAANGESGVGAVFDYSGALGDLKRLEPSAVTDAVPWRLEASSAVETDFHLGIAVTGFVEVTVEE